MSVNGIFKESILFTIDDDIFCPINRTTKIIINRYEISKFLEIYERYKNFNNILIDSRLIECIIYGILYYDNEILIYNVINNKCENIFIFTRTMFQINNSVLNISYVKKLMFLHLFIGFYFKNINGIIWNNTFANKCVKNYTNGDFIDLKYIISYINISCENTKGDNLTKITNQILDIIRCKNLDNIKPLSKSYKIEEIQMSLIQLSLIGTEFNVEKRN